MLNFLKEPSLSSFALTELTPIIKMKDAKLRCRSNPNTKTTNWYWLSNLSVNTRDQDTTCYMKNTNNSGIRTIRKVRDRYEPPLRISWIIKRSSKESVCLSTKRMIPKRKNKVSQRSREKLSTNKWMKNKLISWLLSTLTITKRIPKNKWLNYKVSVAS